MVKLRKTFQKKRYCQTNESILKHILFFEAEFFLTNFSLRYLQVIGDGNCFFRAVSLFLFGTQNFHQKIRTFLRNYKKECFDFFKNNFDKDELDKNKKTNWVAI